MRVIFDLDGTLADCTHRLHHIQKQPKDWGAFYEACFNDAPIRALVDLLFMVDGDGADVAIWTGRSVETFGATLEWLGHLGLSPDIEIRMRPAGDHRHDDVLKREWLHSLPKSEWPDLVFEDRSRVVDMWRAEGITCCQVAPGDF